MKTNLVSMISNTSTSEVSTPMKTYRTHSNQFPDIVIPECVLLAVKSGLLDDISWGNDCAPSFMLRTDNMSDADNSPILLCDHAEVEKRELRQHCRYTVTTMTETLLETNSAEEALLYLAGSFMFKIQTVCTNGWADIKQSNDYGNYVTEYYSTITEAEAELADFCDPENYRIVPANTPANEDLYS